MTGTQPELIYSTKGHPPTCSICCTEVGEEHDVWCNGTGTVKDDKEGTR